MKNSLDLKKIKEEKVEFRINNHDHIFNKKKNLSNIKDKKKKPLKDSQNINVIETKIEFSNFEEIIKKKSNYSNFDEIEIKEEKIHMFDSFHKLLNIKKKGFTNLTEKTEKINLLSEENIDTKKIFRKNNKNSDILDDEKDIIKNKKIIERSSLKNLFIFLKVLLIKIIIVLSLYLLIYYYNFLVKNIQQTKLKTIFLKNETTYSLTFSNCIFEIVVNENITEPYIEILEFYKKKNEFIIPTFTSNNHNSTYFLSYGQINKQYCFSKFYFPTSDKFMNFTLDINCEDNCEFYSKKQNYFVHNQKDLENGQNEKKSEKPKYFHLNKFKLKGRNSKLYLTNMIIDDMKIVSDKLIFFFF